MIYRVLISYLLWILTAYVVYMNLSNKVLINLLIFKGETQLGLVILVSVIFGCMLTLLISLPIINTLSRMNKNYVSEYEKSSTKTMEKSEKVKVLENKIVVLEKALKDALNK